MKRTTLYFLLFIAAISSCRKDKSPAFDKPADERINETLNQYQSVLTGAPNGWTGMLVTKLGLTFSFYFRFGDNNRVIMYSDFDTTTAGTAKESSFRLKALQQPALIFDTYSYIHLPADPDGGVNGGINGGGLLSDFEFSIDTLNADSILLTGRFNESRAVFKRASLNDRYAWENKQVYHAVKSLNDIDKILNYFKRLNYNGTEYELQLNRLNKTATITWKNGSTPESIATPYYFTADGVQFGTSVTNGSDIIKGFAITGWDQTAEALKIKVNNSTEGAIKGAISPMNPDVDAGKRWWQWGADLQSYYISETGFHVNGVDDAFGVRALKTDTSEFFALIYWPGIKAQSGVFDAFTPYFYYPATNSVDWPYGTGQRPTFRSDGRVQFTLLGDLTGGDYPTSGPAYQTKVQLFIPEGYWFVQTSANSYDMVSAKDAKAWITWRNE